MGFARLPATARVGARLWWTAGSAVPEPPPGHPLGGAGPYGLVVYASSAVMGWAQTGSVRVGDVAETAADVENALLGRVARGDERALAELYDRLAPLAYGLSLRICPDVSVAQEAVQNAFVRVWSRSGVFDARRGRARAWVLRIVRNATIDALRSRDALRRADVHAAPDDLAPAAPGPDEQVIGAQRQASLHSALAGLPDQQRRLIEIAYFQGLSHSEIAAREQLPLGTVKTRIRDGVIRLRRLAMEGKLDGC